MQSEATSPRHTIVLSDIHIADAEPPHPGNPLWKRFKRPKLFVDRTFKRFLEYLRGTIKEPFEVVLNGDIFDFDSVMALPKHKIFPITWLEKSRGLASEEAKSRYKMRVILSDHSLFVEALREHVLAGNHVVFIIGNHDVELHWPSVQEEVMRCLELPDDHRSHVRFCEWFYLAGNDTLIEHGNQYDDYCLCHDPIHPLIKKGSRVLVRLPFGNLAGKFMLNGIGLMNPHVDTSFIKPVREYIVFFYRYVLRTQPFILWTWFWGAVTTLLVSLTEGFLPPLKDPLTVESRVEDIARRSNATPQMVRSLRELHVHPAVFDPLKIMRELWLDRAFLLVLILFASFEVFSTLNLFAEFSTFWFFLPLMAFLPIFIFYARSVQSEISKVNRSVFESAALSSRIAGVRRVIHGHTHKERHSWLDQVEVINTGTWSAAYKDVECTQPLGRKCFAWIQPKPDGSGRMGELYEWKDPDAEIMMPSV